MPATTKAIATAPIADYNEAIRLDPHNARFYYDRGIAYRRQGDIDRAMTDLSEAIGLDPRHAGAYNERGYAYYQKHDFARAIADYDQAIKLNPKFAVAYNNRGNAYDDKGETDQGHRRLQRGAARRCHVCRRVL